MATPHIETGAFVNISATAAVTPGPTKLIGFYVNNTAAGTLVLRDGGASGRVISGTITPDKGFHRYPCDCGVSLHATIANLDVTFFVVPQV